MIEYLFPIAAVVIGSLIVYFLKPTNPQNVKILLSFSGGFLLAITIFNLMPEVFEHIEKPKQIGVFIIIGILFQIFLEYFSKGAEHGHIHISSDKKKFPTLLFISLFSHSVLEGFPIHETHGMLAGIIIHKIPVAIILTTFLLQSSLPKKYIFLFLSLFALATPIGSLISQKFNIINQYHKQITAIVVGIFLHISTTILFESSEGHKYNLTKLAAIISAIIIAYFI